MTPRDPLPRDSDGRLVAFAWPGGYPVVYVTSDGEVDLSAVARAQTLLVKIEGRV